MNTKHYLAAIFAAAILSIGFLSCDPKEDDPTTNPTTSTDVVKEIYGYYGKPAEQVIALLDAKGWMKITDSTSYGIIYTYLSIDSNKTYAIYSIDNTIKGSGYGEVEMPILINKLASNTNKFISLFEKWEESLSKISILNSVYQGTIIANDYQFEQDYESREMFLTDFQLKKPSLNSASSSFSNSQMRGYVSINLDYETDDSEVYVVFEDSLISENINKNNNNTWFRK
ncbi:MAG: hypothetical protein H6Q16_1150 [Bacteroidetes bacterium]|nr:hypothetical protein [Bacteroidota bacterium]